MTECEEFLYKSGKALDSYIKKSTDYSKLEQFFQKIYKGCGFISIGKRREYISNTQTKVIVEVKATSYMNIKTYLGCHSFLRDNIVTDHEFDLLEKILFMHI